MNDQKILMTHYRVGKTDGVSIEMNSWKNMLESEGMEVRYCAGPESIGADYVIDDLEQQLNDEVFLLDQEAFGGFDTFQNEKEFINEFDKVSENISNEFEEVIKDFKPTNILISNMFCVGEGLPAAKGILSILDKYKIPTIFINHDFYWEEIRYQNPSCDYVKEYLEKYLTPDRDYITHCTINKIGNKSLKERKDIDSTVFYDTFDFENSNWDRRNSITEILRGYGISEDTFVFLQATRIVRRKNIELAIDLVKEFQSLVYSSSINFPYNKVVLLLAGYVERRDAPYLEALIEYSKKVGVELIYIGDRMHTDYELFDIYPYGDVITYPSEYEGFGNQLLEAFNIGKPVVIYEYPVYKADIKSLGFDVISLGDEIEGERENGLKYIDELKIKQATNKLIGILDDEKQLEQSSTRNKKIAKEHFGFDVTKEKLLSLIERS